jgi:hypothetical protein
LTFNPVILIILETLEKEEVMKKIFLVLVIVLVALPLSARPKIEFSPRGSLYIDGGVNFGIGGDIIVNPKKQFGVRVNIAEVVFGDNTAFSLNMLNLGNFTNFDILYYTDIAGLFSYIDITFGLLSQGGGTMLAVGGGLGLEKYMGKGNYIFLEPAIVFISNSAGANDLMFKGSVGVKLGL